MAWSSAVLLLVATMSDREVGTVPGERLTEQVNVVYGPNAGSADVPNIDKGMRQMAYQLQSWVNNKRAVTGQSSLIDRGKKFLPGLVA